MESGKLKHRITLQRPSIDQDTAGEHTVTFSDVAAVKASIEPLSVREQFMAAQEHASATHRIRFRLRQSLSAMDGSWRVVYGARTFVLVGLPINMDEANRETQLLCEEGLKVE